jgi:hypothetical protein
MKYLITESQVDKLIFKYLDNQDFIRIENNDKILFVNSEMDKHVQISYDENNGSCGIYYRLINEISDFFSIEKSDSKEVIGRWVENTLQRRITNIKKRI